MATTKIRFMVMGRPGDSPEVNPTVKIDLVIPWSNKRKLIDTAFSIAHEAYYAAQEVLMDELDAETQLAGVYAEILNGISAYIPDDGLGQIYAWDFTDESTWITTIRVYGENE